MQCGMRRNAMNIQLQAHCTFSHKIITLDVAVYVANGLKDFFVIIFFSLQQHSRG